MARKLRIEYPGAFYHVINRGNFRSWIFETEGARHAFLLWLKECCEAKSWLADNLSIGKPSSVQS